SVTSRAFVEAWCLRTCRDGRAPVDELPRASIEAADTEDDGEIPTLVNDTGSFDDFLTTSDYQRGLRLCGKRGDEPGLRGRSLSPGRQRAGPHHRAIGADALRLARDHRERPGERHGLDDVTARVRAGKRACPGHGLRRHVWLLETSGLCISDAVVPARCAYPPPAKSARPCGALLTR